jgi:hypothetical protein
MSAKHQTAEYARNARIIRGRVSTLHRRGQPAMCWRCRRPIHPGEPFDVGHLQGATGSALTDLAPEHRHRTGACPGNRRDGGAKGAAITNARRVSTQPATAATTWPI